MAGPPPGGPVTARAAGRQPAPPPDPIRSAHVLPLQAPCAPAQNVPESDFLHVAASLT